MCKEHILDFFDLVVLFAAGLIGLILVYAALFFLSLSTLTRGWADMQFKVTPKFWLDLGLAAFLPLLAWYAFDDLKHGRAALAALTCTIFLFNLYGSRWLFDLLLTNFCMWWLKRKAKEAVNFLDSLHSDRKNDAP